MNGPLSLLLAAVLLACTGGSDEVSPTNEEALDSLFDQIDATRIGEFIRSFSALPRNTQSDWMGEKEATLKENFANFGFKVVTKKYKVLQCFPKDVDPSLTEVLDASGNVLETYREDGNPEEKVLPAFNAWSKSGNVTGKPVYVNYGRKEDFAKLKADGVELNGTIGIARYGKIYRGDKAKFAKQYGLIGLIIYMDAADYAPEGVPTMPDGPGLPVTGIQRGTLKDGLGDPSTYLYPSTKYAYHDPPEVYEERLPRIVVMPTNFQNALPLLGGLAGADVPAEWQGAGNISYPTYKSGPGFAAGSDRKLLRITVNLEYKMVEIEDIFGIVKGKQEPDRWVMIGNHRDTWVHGAVDATTGLATLNELGHGVSQLLSQGWQPRRTIVFASWGAEEQGIIGSTEFVEDYITLLQEKLVAYVNVDVAAADQKLFKPAGTPNFRPLLEKAAKRASAPLEYGSLYEQWLNVNNVSTADGDVANLKTLGSGSDYAAFINMAGISSIDLTIVGPYYTYHTEYDNHHYLSRYADPGFLGTKAVAEVAAVVLFELATKTVVPLDAVSYSSYIKDTIAGSEQLKLDLEGQDIDISILTKAIDKFVENAQSYENRKATYENKSRFHMELRRFNDKMMLMERSFIYPQGLPGRPQNRHVLFAPSILNSYSGSVFPGIFDCVAIAKESGTESDWNQVRKQVTIATWVTRAAGRALSNAVFPN